MEKVVCPVAVISVCSPEGVITPLRLQIVDGEGQNLRIDIEQVVSIREIPYVSGFCYTQFSDVQQEINGVVDEERNAKADPETIRKINMD